MQKTGGVVEELTNENSEYYFQNRYAQFIDF